VPWEFIKLSGPITVIHKHSRILLSVICEAAPTTLECAPMPWRRKPASWLAYWKGPVNRNAGFRTVIVYCLGPVHRGPCCGHSAPLRLADLPDWDWREISAHLRCTKCGTVGYVDTRLNWSEVVNFDKGIS
jgi:hypothetical protein